MGDIRKLTCEENREKSSQVSQERERSPEQGLVTEDNFFLASKSNFFGITF